MTERISTSDLNRRLGEILDRVKAGEVFELTRYGKVVAVLSPAPSGGFIVTLKER